LQYGVKCVKDLASQLAVVAESSCGTLERTGIQRCRTVLRLPTACDHTCDLEHSEVLGYGGEAQV
jgi:hypothetical protein